MNSPMDGTITRIIIAVQQKLYDNDTIVIITQKDERIILNKINTMSNINVYEINGQISNTGYISWTTDLLLPNNLTAIIDCNENNNNFNRVNYMIPDYCTPAIGENMFSKYLFSRKVAITIFLISSV